MKIGIVAHHARLQQAQLLAGITNAAVVSIDSGTLGHAANHRAVWEALAPLTQPKEWASVLEDDAQLCEAFRYQAAAALDAIPGHDVASLYLGRLTPTHWQQRIAQAITRADHEHAHWIETDITLNAVAVAIRGHLIRGMLDATAESQRPWDEAVTQWVRRFNHRVAYTHPSLVEHSDGPTLIQHADGQPRPPGRVAWRHGTRPHWNNRTVNL